MNSRRILLTALALMLIGIVVGCSSKNNSNPTGPSGGGGMGGGGPEFVSGDMQAGASFTHVFKTAKVIPYYCKYHGGPGGVGMAGVITVVTGGTPKSLDLNITGFTLPTVTVHVMDTVTWTNNTQLLHTVQSDH